MRVAVEAVLAMPVHDAGRHLECALDTLLAQTEERIALVALDDSSSDASLDILREKARTDERLIVHSSPERLGIPRAWNRVMELALDHAPTARFVAWAGDHDRWSADWLSSLAGELDATPGAVLAVPLTRKIAADDTILREDERRLDTSGLEDPLARVAATAREMVAGNQIYGLFRREALARALPAAHVLLYDRLVLAQVALEGPIVQVDRLLWDRRSFRKPVATVLDRERATFWPEGAPAWSHLPPVIQSGAVLTRRALTGRLGPPDVSRSTALLAALTYVRETRRVEKEVKERRRRRAARAAARERG